MERTDGNQRLAAIKAYARSVFGNQIALAGLIAGLMFVAGALPAKAQQIFPGETFVFTSATAGHEACREDISSNPCRPLRITNAEATPAENKVFTRTRSGLAGSTVGEALYATASVSNVFEIPGPSSGLVDVQISVKYDFSGTFLAASAYTLENLLQLRIEDSSRDEIVSTHQLAKMQRQGDQGVTDINFAEERAVLFGEVALFVVKLRRGGIYRLHFEAQSSSVTFASGNLRVSGTAAYEWISVSVDEDEAEQLSIHDGDIKAEFAGLGADHDELMADHDELMADHDEIKADLAEIKTLLLTPQGRRPGFPEEGVPPPGKMKFRGNRSN